MLERQKPSENFGFNPEGDKIRLEGMERGMLVSKRAIRQMSVSPLSYGPVLTSFIPHRGVG